MKADDNAEDGDKKILVVLLVVLLGSTDTKVGSIIVKGRFILPFFVSANLSMNHGCRYLWPLWVYQFQGD